MKEIKWSKEHDAEGGIGWAVDFTGEKIPLTKDEARYWPGLVTFIPWKLSEGIWRPST